MGKTIALVPCSKEKKTLPPSVTIPARDLYTGPLFKKALECAESLHPDEIYILSAKYGVVELDQKLTYYDMYLHNQPKSYRLSWAEKVLEQLRDHGVDVHRDKIVFLTGNDYYSELVHHITNYEIIGKGLRPGEKMHEFDEIKKGRK